MEAPPYRTAWCHHSGWDALAASLAREGWRLAACYESLGDGPHHRTRGVRSFWERTA